MSVTERFNPHHEFIRDTKAEIYKRFTDVLKLGTYYPAKGDTPAEMVSPAEALGGMAGCSANADIINQPQEIHVSWHRPEQRRHINLWLTETEIEAEYYDYDDNCDPYVVLERAPIHPEALIELHQQIMNAPS